jgi:uncharacterized membrane protein
MKVVKFCLLPVLLLVVLAVAGGWFYFKDMPTEWNVDVSVEIDAPAAEIHPYIEDLHRWKDWNGFHESFGDSDFTYEGAERGVGAVMTSKSEGSNVRIEITASDPAKGVWFDELLENTIEAKGVILYEEADGKTTVRWQDRGTFGDFIFMRPMNLMLQEALTEGFQANLEMLKEVIESAE